MNHLQWTVAQQQLCQTSAFDRLYAAVVNVMDARSQNIKCVEVPKSVEVPKIIEVAVATARVASIEEPLKSQKDNADGLDFEGMIATKADELEFKRAFLGDSSFPRWETLVQLAVLLRRRTHRIASVSNLDAQATIDQ